MKDINATVIVDLNKEEKELFENMHKDARWGIKKARKEELRVEEGKERDWREFYKIYRETVTLGGTNPESLEELRKNTFVFFVCKYKNKIIAGSGIKLSNDYRIEIPRLYFNASLQEYQKFQPNNLLYWECILWCKNKGYEKFDLGGYQIRARGHLEGINKFKEKWGKIVYYYKEYPAWKAIGRKLIRNFSFFWWLNKKLRGRK